MPLQKTNLVIVAAQLPPDFEGNPQEYFAAMLERMEIQSPVGISFFVIGDVEPASNSGPWFKNGTKLYVFDINTGHYVPLDISDSLSKFAFIGPNDPGTPNTNDPLIWFRSVGNRPLGWYGWDGNSWEPGPSVPPSGDTASRPSNPADLEQYFDTDINTLIHWERSAWRTVSGTPGDIKAVTADNLTLALKANPGWSLLFENDESKRGRALAQASKDAGASPDNAVSTPAGITQRAANDVFGEELHVLGSLEIQQHSHMIGHATLLNSVNGNVVLFRVDDADTEILNAGIPDNPPPNSQTVRATHSAPNGGSTGVTLGGTGTQIMTSRQFTLEDAPHYTAAAVGHNTVPPTVFLWHLVKD
jgi:hypothetical protein